jgi:glycerol-3-phosphate O-acyltransferase / dihydroxyacetone phosphate acyltransferase
MFYTFLRIVLGTCLDLFYSRTSLGGAVPAEGPIVLVANHPNGLIDPMLVGRIAPRQVCFLAKAPLFRMPLVGRILAAAGALPVYRPSDSPGEQDKNEQTFAACFDALDRGAALCIFPEGVSHSEPALQRLKTGAARIVLGAEARRGFTLGVRVVPVGLTYRDKHLFRGRVAAEVGAPIETAAFREAWTEEPRKAIEALTACIGEELSKVTLNVERWEDLPALEAAEAIDATERGLNLSASERQARLRAFAEGLRTLRGHAPEKVEALRGHVTAYVERLRSLGADPLDLDTRYTPAVVLRFVLRNLLRLLSFPLAALGVLLFIVPYQLPRLVTERSRPELDIVASVKLGVALVAFPAWTALVLVAAGLTAGAWAALGLALLTPVAGWYAIHFQESLEEALEDLAVFFRLGLRRARKRHLLARRAELARQIDALIQEHDALARSRQQASAG